MKKIIIGILVVVVISFIVVLFTKNSSEVVENSQGDDISDVSNTEQDKEVMEEVDEKQTVIGSSVNGNDIVAYHYGNGSKELLFTSGLHGGYEWNAVLMSYELMDYLEQNPESIPENIRVTIVPVLNPDGLERAVGTTGTFTASDAPSSNSKLAEGRFNANNVDLNRNFDCDWQDSGVWQNKKVSGGTEAFSEPETLAFKNFVESTDPSAVVVWYSSAGGVYTSSCHNGVLDETTQLVKLFSKASGYPANEDFDFYEITGDAVNWLAKINVPAISVLMTNHTDLEVNKNIAGIKAIFGYYSE